MSQPSSASSALPGSAPPSSSPGDPGLPPTPPLPWIGLHEVVVAIQRSLETSNRLIGLKESPGMSLRVAQAEVDLPVYLRIDPGTGDAWVALPDSLCEPPEAATPAATAPGQDSKSITRITFSLKPSHSSLHT